MRHASFVIGLLLVGTAACGDNGHVVADRDVGSAGASASGGRSPSTAGQDPGGGVLTGGANAETGGTSDAGAPPTGGSGDGGASASGGQSTGGAPTTGGQGTGGSTGGEDDGGTATGGSGDGGTPATGGQGTGGVPATGGQSTGGMPATGGGGTGGSTTGGQSTGGTPATGGQITGGTPATGGQGTGGMIVPNCAYRDIPGKGRITSIEPATEADGTLCANGSVSARYAFTPDDSSLSPDEYDVAAVNMDPVRYHQLTTGSSQLIPPACVDQLGLEVNGEYTVIRRIATSGSCTPAMDSFPDLDLTSCTSLCS
ncbi:MAG: hypothetical protein JW751_20635 [Polyangiaceae bacterium]|nr:hypothetical protein [Polyangiaceae bacterium]